MNKEQIYDAKLSPLMNQIIAICREHGIAMIATFAIPTEEHKTLLCTTSLCDESKTLPRPLHRILEIAVEEAPLALVPTQR